MLRGFGIGSSPTNSPRPRPRFSVRRSTTHLNGIDPDGRVHVSERLLMLNDGPLLEQSLKAVAGSLIRLPRPRQHHPDRDQLAIRFEQFKRAA